MNVYDCAMAMEEDARKRFEVLAYTVTVPELQSLFALLARAEDEHLRHLRGLKEGANGSGDFGALDDAFCIFRGLVDQKETVAAMDRDPDLYRHLVAQEEESIRFYEELAERAVRDGEKVQLLKLAEEERRHLEVVENIYAFVESPRTFLAWGEFANLGQL